MRTKYCIALALLLFTAVSPLAALAEVSQYPTYTDCVNDNLEKCGVEGALLLCAGFEYPAAPKPAQPRNDEVIDEIADAILKPIVPVLRDLDRLFE